VSLPPFQAFFDEHRHYVFRFLRATLGPDDADDAFQETFISALRAYPRLRADSNLRAWVLTIAHNKAIDEHRARSRRPVAATADDVAGPEKAPPEPALWAAVRRLPPRQRTAVVHRYVGDLPYREMAEVMGCSEEAARQNVHEGLKSLRKGCPR